MLAAFAPFVRGDISVMRVAFFYPSLTQEIACGTSHFIRGICSELIQKNHKIEIFEPAHHPNTRTESINPYFSVNQKENYTIHFYHPEQEESLTDSKIRFDFIDLALIHVSTAPRIIQLIGKIRRQTPQLRVLIHDHLHKIFSEPEQILNLDLKYIDGVLTSRRDTQQMYLHLGLTDRSWTWPEAIQTARFQQIHSDLRQGELVHTGMQNREDFESYTFQDQILSAAKELNLRIKLYGKFTPQYFSAEDYKSQIYFRGLIPHHKIPQILSQSRITFYTPKTINQRSTPSTPSMRLLESMACEIPLIATQWDDTENLFTPGKDYLITNHKDETKDLIQLLLGDTLFRSTLTKRARDTISSRFSAEQRASELEVIYQTFFSKSNQDSK